MVTDPFAAGDGMTKLSERDIVRAVAEAVAERVCRQAIAGLQKMRNTLSGDDSALESTWDEICVQVQGEESVYWDVYEESIHTVVSFAVDELKPYEREALWLQTPEGNEWLWSDRKQEQDEYPVSCDEITRYLMQSYVLVKADLWSNTRIRRFLDRQSMRD